MTKRVTNVLDIQALVISMTAQAIPGYAPFSFQRHGTAQALCLYKGAWAQLQALKNFSDLTTEGSE